VERKLAPNPKRARQLEFAAAKRGSLRLKDAWPHLALVMCRPSVNLTEVEVRGRGYRIEGGVPSAFA
jgi:hypothetical protein